jgi:MFS family permease
LSWRWIFYINVPIGLLSIYFIATAYRESKNTRKQVIDWTGAVLLTGAILCLMFGLELGGSEGWAWDSAKTVSLFVGSGVLLALFLWAESVAKDPIIKLGLFRKRLFMSSMAISLLYGGVMIAGATYIPIFIQGVFHKTATETSSVLTPMMLGVVLSSQIGGRVASLFRYRDVMLVSVFTLLIGSCLLGFAMDTGTSRLVITLFMVIIGLGMGVSFSLLNISTLGSVPPQYKGSASSLITFFRTIGSALGVTVFGTLQKHHFQQGIQEVPNLSPELAGQIKGGQALLDPAIQERMGLAPDIVNGLLAKLADSITYIFQWSVLLPALAVVFVLLMGSARMEKAAPGPQKTPDDKPGKAEPSYNRG